MNDLFPVTIDDALAELNREMEQRRRVYPRLIERGTLTQPRADRQNAALMKEIEILLDVKHGRLTAPSKGA